MYILCTADIPYGYILSSILELPLFKGLCYLDKLVLNSRIVVFTISVYETQNSGGNWHESVFIVLLFLTTENYFSRPALPN